MGVLESAICLDCLEEFSGKSSKLIGYPSMSVDKNPVITEYEEGALGDKKNFGFLYSGLKSLSLCSKSVEEYTSFLEKHFGHRMYLYNDHSDEHPPELSDGYDDIKEFNPEEFETIEAFYEIKCNDCMTATRLDHKVRHKIRPFESFKPTTEQIDRFYDNAMLRNSDSTSDVEENFCCAFDLFAKKENIQNIGTFLYYHSTHDIEISLNTSTETGDYSLFTIDEHIEGSTERRLILVEKIKPFISKEDLKQYINESPNLGRLGKESLVKALAWETAFNIEKININAYKLNPDEVEKICRDNKILADKPNGNISSSTIKYLLLALLGVLFAVLKIFFKNYDF